MPGSTIRYEKSSPGNERSRGGPAIKGFRIIEHTADTGIAVQGRDLPEFFVNAARGLFQVITETRAIQPAESRSVEVSAEDLEGLLLAWLNELIFLFDSEGMLFRRFGIEEFSHTRMKATAYGERVDPTRHDLKTAVKSTTYHGLNIQQAGDRYVGRIIFDI